MACSFVRFSRTPRFHCTCFFSVHEKQGRQCLIVDAGETNRHFKRPPSVALASPQALAGMECSTESRFWISTVDVRDAFHRMALPDGISDCFALPGGTAREFSVCELDGRGILVAMLSAFAHGIQLGGVLGAAGDNGVGG